MRVNWHRAVDTGRWGAWNLTDERTLKAKLFLCFLVAALLHWRQLLSPSDSSSGMILDLSRLGLRRIMGEEDGMPGWCPSSEACFHLVWPFIWQEEKWRADHLSIHMQSVHMWHHVLTDLHTVIVKSTKHSFLLFYYILYISLYYYYFQM